MNIERAVGAELRACRRKKQISQEQLGFDAGIHRTYVSLIERGAKGPTLRRALSLVSSAVHASGSTD
jgi:transcriptional regulator with XRE-family HTH domain